MPNAENSSQPVPVEATERLGTTPIDTERLRALLAASTPGPWGWRGHDDGTVELRGHGPCGAYDGRIVSAMRSEPCVVYLDDESLALANGACDTCRNAFEHTDLDEKVVCEKPENLGTVWLKGEAAIEPANKWAVREVPYRGDVVAVDHPDAQLIAEAVTALPALLDEVDRLRRDGDDWMRMYLEAVRVFRTTCLDVAKRIEEGGSLADLVDLVGAYMDQGCDGQLDDETIDLLLGAKAKATATAADGAATVQRAELAEATLAGLFGFIRAQLDPHYDGQWGDYFTDADQQALANRLQAAATPDPEGAE